MLVWETYIDHRGRDSLSGIKHTMENGVELLQVLEGKGHFVVGGELFPLRRGVVLLIDSECLHCSVPEEGSEYVRNKLILDRAAFLTLSSLAQSDMKQGCFFALGEEATEAITRLIRRYAEPDPPRGWEEITCIARMMELCADAKESGTAQSASGDPILDYINEHLEEPLTLEILAKETHFSKYYLCELFRRKTGMTPMQYVRLLRISRAQRLLLSTSDSISNIGLACGYDNFSFFCRVFRSVSGMSPSDYRKRMGSGRRENVKNEQKR